MKYEIMKIMSKGDQTVREIMIYFCYVIAEEDEVSSNACDLVERDILEALWKGLPFHRILKVNNSKYMNVEGEMENDIYIQLSEVFDNFAIEFFELMDEIDTHKDVTLLRLKQVIDDKTKAIVHFGRLHPELV